MRLHVETAGFMGKEYACKVRNISRSRITKILWCAILVLLLGSRSLTADEPPALAEKPGNARPAQATITGVILENRRPVPGAKVKASYMYFTGGGWRPTLSAETTSDASGRFALAVPRTRISGLKIIARTQDFQRMGFWDLGSSADPEDASVRYLMADPARIQDVEVRLSPAVQREIQAVDDNGEPVKAADVRVYLFSDWNFATTSTDAEGKAEVWWPAQFNRAEIAVWKRSIGLDHARVSTQGRRRFVPPVLANAPLKFTLRKAPTVQVKVVDAITNKPLRETAVSIQIPGKRAKGFAGFHLGFGISATTDETGWAKIDWLPDWAVNEELAVWCRDPEYVYASKSLTIGRDKPVVTLNMKPLMQLRGRVLGADGKPAAGIVVEAGAQENEAFDRTVTDRNGEYQLTSPPDLNVVVVAVDDRWGAEPQTVFEIEKPGVSAKVGDMKLTPAKRVHGRIQTEGTKEPVAGQQIWLHIFGPSQGEGKWPEQLIAKDAPRAALTTWTDENGRYEFHIGPSVFQIVAPKQVEAADGKYFNRIPSHWSRNLPQSQNTIEFDFTPTVWTDEP